MRGGDQHPDGDPGQQDQHQVVVLQPEPGGSSGTKPPPRPAAQQRGGHAEHHGRPQEQVQRGGVVHVHGGEDDRGARGGQRGQHPPEPARAEQRGAPGRDDDDGAARERGDDPDRGRAHPQHAGDDPGQQRGERRLVHVAEGEMPPGLDEVQLVLHEAVSAADRELQRNQGGRDQPGGQRHAVGRRGGPEPGKVRTDPDFGVLDARPIHGAPPRLGNVAQSNTALLPGREGRQLSQLGDQTYGVVMARQVKPSRSRIGRLIGEASTCR